MSNLYMVLLYKNSNNMSKYEKNQQMNWITYWYMCTKKNLIETLQPLSL